MPPLPAFPPTRHQAGFVPLPRPLFDGLLAADLTKRQLKVLLLVARLNYCCRDSAWAKLRPADLAAVGIGPSHAGASLKGLLAAEVLVQNGQRPEYRLNGLALWPRQMLGPLVRRQLTGDSRAGNREAARGAS